MKRAILLGLLVLILVITASGAAVPSAFVIRCMSKGDSFVVYIEGERLIYAEAYAESIDRYPWIALAPSASATIREYTLDTRSIREVHAGLMDMKYDGVVPLMADDAPYTVMYFNGSLIFGGGGQDGSTRILSHLASRYPME